MGMYVDLIHNISDFVVYATAQLRPNWHDRGFRVDYLNPKAVVIQCSPAGPSVVVAETDTDEVTLQLVQGNRAEWRWKDVRLPRPEAAKVLAETFRAPLTEKLSLAENPYLQELAYDLDCKANWDSELPDGRTLRSYALALADSVDQDHPHIQVIADAIEFDMQTTESAVPKLKLTDQKVDDKAMTLEEDVPAKFKLIES